MKKAIFGIAAVLVLTTTPAWAREAKATEKVATNTSASRDGASKSKGVMETVRRSGDVRDTQGSAGSDKMNPTYVSASHAERWLVEREGYRDGGY